MHVIFSSQNFSIVVRMTGNQYCCSLALWIVKAWQNVQTGLPWAESPSSHHCPLLLFQFQNQKMFFQLPASLACSSPLSEQNIPPWNILSYFQHIIFKRVLKVTFK